MDNSFYLYKQVRAYLSEWLRIVIISVKVILVKEKNRRDL